MKFIQIIEYTTTKPDEVQAALDEFLAATGGTRTNNLAVHASGARIYVSNGGDASVSVIDTATNKVTATIAVGKRPWGLALTPDGKKLYVANGRSDSISVIDTEKNVKLRDIPVGQMPWGVVVK